MKFPDILDMGLMLSVRVEVVAAVTNFCHSAPSKKELDSLNDERLHVTFVVHPKLAHHILPQESRNIKGLITQYRRCRGIGEIGVDLTGQQVHLQEQLSVFREYINFYVSKQLLSLVLVLHCRSQGYTSEASDHCLRVMDQKVPIANRRSVRVHRHCYNGSLEEKDKWLQKFPGTMFGFTSIILYSNRHNELDQVVKSLPLSKILLESDSPYLLAPVHQNEKFNSPYGVIAVAERIAELKGVSLKEVLTITSGNARGLYGMAGVSMKV